MKEFPAAHLPLIAKLVHEWCGFAVVLPSSTLLTPGLSDETYTHAATRIHKLLAAQVPVAPTSAAFGSLTLTKPVVEAAVKRVSDRVNWGVENGVAVRCFDFGHALHTRRMIVHLRFVHLGSNYLAPRSQRQKYASSRVPADLRGEMERTESGLLSLCHFGPLVKYIQGQTRYSDRSFSTT